MNTEERLQTWVVEIRSNGAIVTDTEEQRYLALYNHQVNEHGLRVGDCLTGIVSPSSRGPRPLLTAVHRTPQVRDVQHLPEMVEVKIHAPFARHAFARDAEGNDFITFGQFERGAVVRGRPEPSRNGYATPVLRPC